MSEVKRYEKLDEIDSYFNEIKKFRPLSKKEEYKLIDEVQNGNEVALKKLVESNLKFVVSIAKKYRKSGVCFSDLISEGNIGLIKAAHKFDKSKGTKFITYAVWWVKSCIQDCIENYKKQSEFSTDGFVFGNAVNQEYEYNSNLINSEYNENTGRA